LISTDRLRTIYLGKWRDPDLNHELDVDSTIQFLTVRREDKPPRFLF